MKTSRIFIYITLRDPNVPGNPRASREPHVFPHRKHIYRERGIPDIESLLFEDHEMIRRAAAECMCNLVYCDEVNLL